MSARSRSWLTEGLALVLSSTLVLAGCGASPSAPADSDGASAGSSTAVEETVQQDAAALERYRQILSDVDSMGPFDPELPVSDPTYQYALVTMQKGEGPSLLLAQGQDNGTSLVRVYYYDEDTATLYDTGSSYDSSDYSSFGKAFLQMGVAGAGGFRGSLSLESDGNGIMLAAFAAGTGEGEIDRYTREGSELVAEQQGTFSLANGDEMPMGDDIRWFDATDEAPLDAWPDAAEAAADADVSSSTDAGGAPADATDGLTLTGTIRVTNNEGLGSLTGEPDPNAAYESAEEKARLTAVLVLDSPADVTCTTVDGTTSTVSTSIVVLPDGFANSANDGRRATVNFGTSSFWLPSDTSMPIGAPRASSATEV